KIHGKLIKMCEQNELIYYYDNYFHLKRYEEANKTMNKILALGDGGADVYVRLGIYHERRNRYKEAIDALKKAQKLSPGDPNINLYLDRCYRRIRPEGQAEKGLHKGSFQVRENLKEEKVYRKRE
ncbi:MAG: hypothetical protein DRP74_07435, partial [Candidatus Omnitrophota bacterium]